MLYPPFSANFMFLSAVINSTSGRGSQALPCTLPAYADPLAALKLSSATSQLTTFHQALMYSGLRFWYLQQARWEGGNHSMLHEMLSSFRSMRWNQFKNLFIKHKHKGKEPS